jgi:hypothetical protein
VDNLQINLLARQAESHDGMSFLVRQVCYREGQVTCGPVIEKAKIELI